MTLTKKDRLCIHHHLGLGDTIECNGMIRHFAEIYNHIDIFAKSNYFETIKFMYRDNSSICVHKVDPFREGEEVSNFLSNYTGEILIPGFDNYFSNLAFFEKNQMGPGESFYYIARVPWKFRNEKFFVKRDLTKESEVFTRLNPNNEKFVFVHDDPSRGFNIDITTPHKIIKNDPSVGIFDLIKLLEEAEEIHCMSSSILCLIDCLSSQINFKKLYLHYNLRKVYLGPNGLFGNWTII